MCVARLEGHRLSIPKGRGSPSCATDSPSALGRYGRLCALLLGSLPKLPVWLVGSRDPQLHTLMLASGLLLLCSTACVLTVREQARPASSGLSVALLGCEADAGGDSLTGGDSLATDGPEPRGVEQLAKAAAGPRAGAR